MFLPKSATTLYRKRFGESMHLTCDFGAGSRDTAGRHGSPPCGFGMDDVDLLAVIRVRVFKVSRTHRTAAN